MPPREDRDTARDLLNRAHLHLECGDRIAALDLARAALKLDSNCLPAHRLLAGMALTGESFRDLIGRIHGHYRPRGYLELGVAHGTTICLAGRDTLAIGVDPAPQITQPLPPNIRIFRETSDDFFAKRDLRIEFAGAPLELAFIDGMHLFEYALRDFINIERNSAPHARVLVHDCYPLDEATAARERVTDFWTGDIWKLTVCLKKYRPDLQIHTLAAPPSGLAVIRGLDSKSTVLPAQFEAICREYTPYPYSALNSDKRAALNLVAGDWAVARQLLD